jgi:transcriptional regulator with XRE-family HTH domain
MVTNVPSKESVIRKGWVDPDRIKELRQRKGFSQRKLAETAGVPFNTYIKIESGVRPNPQIETIDKIAYVLGVPHTQLGRPGVPVPRLSKPTPPPKGSVPDATLRRLIFTVKRKQAEITHLLDSLLEEVGGVPGGGGNIEPDEEEGS